MIVLCHDWHLLSLDHKTAGLRAVKHRMVCSWLMMVVGWKEAGPWKSARQYADACWEASLGDRNGMSIRAYTPITTR